MRNVKLGEKPASRLQIEYHRIEIIGGALRPKRSASQPEATAPNRRVTSVAVNTTVTAVNGTPKFWLIATMIKRKIVKSNASSVHPSHAAK
jgi:hypothetical protein